MGLRSLQILYMFVLRKEKVTIFAEIAAKVIRKYAKFAWDYIFYISLCFATKLLNFTKLRVIVATVLTNFPNSKVCLVGK